MRNDSSFHGLVSRPNPSDLRCPDYQSPMLLRGDGDRRPTASSTPSIRRYPAGLRDRSLARPTEFTPLRPYAERPGTGARGPTRGIRSAFPERSVLEQPTPSAKDRFLALPSTHNAAVEGPLEIGRRIQTEAGRLID